MRAHDEAVLVERRARMEARLDPSWQVEMAAPMLAGTNLRYEMAARVQAIPCGGIGLIHELVRTLKLAESIDEHVHVFKKHFPYHESDHVLNLAYNVLAGGTRLEDIERLRTNEGYLDTLGCRRIPDPTTAGDFLCRNVWSVQRCVHLWPFASPQSCVEPLSAPSDADPCASPRRVEQVAPISVFSIHELIPKRLFWA